MRAPAQIKLRARTKSHLPSASAHGFPTSRSVFVRRLADADRREVEPPLPRLFAFPGRRLPPWCRTPPDYVFAMSQVEAIEQTIRTLPMEQVRELQEWLQDYLEDLEEMRPEFVARLDLAQQQLDEGKGRVAIP